MGYGVTWLFALVVGGIQTSHAKGLSDLVKLAEERSPAIQKLQVVVEQAKLELQTADLQFFPSLDLEAIHGLQNTDPPYKDTPWSSSLALKLTENLYDNGASITRQKQARTRLELRRLEFEYERDQQILKLANNYYDWSSTSQQRWIDEDKRKLLRRQFAVLEAQYKQGIKTRRDVLRLETEIRRLEIDLLRRDNDLALLVERVAAEAGTDGATIKELAVTAEEPLPSLPRFKAPELKIEAHRRTKIFDLQVKEKEFDTRLIEREYWPRVDLAGELSNSHSDYLDTGKPFDKTEIWGWSALLTLRYNLWDFGNRRRELQKARLVERSVRAQNDQSLLGLGVELHEVGLRLDELSETVKLAIELLKIERQSYNILAIEYRNGRSTYLDLITNLNSWIDARGRFVTAYFGFKKQLALYHFHSGDLREHLKNP